MFKRKFDFHEVLVTAIILLAAIAVAAGIIGSITGCDRPSSGDRRDTIEQKKILDEAQRQIGMPAITNFQEKKLTKMLLELRDQPNLRTYTYVFSSMQGRFVFVGESVGFPIPYATQFTNPQRVTGDSHGNVTMPQADPNGLFSPDNAEGSFVMMINPETKEVKPVYFEERVIVSPFKLR